MAVLIGCAALACAMEQDRRKRRIANSLQIVLVGAFALHAIAHGTMLPVWTHLATSIVVGTPLTIAWWVGRLGAGDVKLAAGCALWAGPAGLELMCLVGGSAALTLSLWTIVEKKIKHRARAHTIALGCAIAPGGLAVIIARTAGAPI